MSLFNVLQWLNYQCPDQQKNYDSFSLSCVRLNAESESNKESVVITSHEGFITVLNPTNIDLENVNVHQSSVVFETKLSQPILGILCGNFISQTQRPSPNLAVLHPEKLVIYSLTASTDTNFDSGQRMKLQMILQHDLEKPAFSFCKGNFGGDKSKESICLMLLDGSLKFFEHEFTSQNSVLHGDRTILTNFIYVPRTDCFIILSTNWDLECYRYLSLSEAYERKCTPIWTMSLGEYVFDMNQHQVSNTESLIVMLGEKSLICVSDTGKVKFIKKFDYTPRCFCSFVVGWYFEPNCKLMIAVATDHGSLLIYHNSLLVWCAQLLPDTVAIQRGNFTGLTGGLVMLSSTGKVSVNYLGSNPSIFKVPPLNLANINYEHSKLQLEEMEKEINSIIDVADVQFINVDAEKNFCCSILIIFDDLNYGEFAKLQVNVDVAINLEQMQFTILEDPAFSFKQNVLYLNDLKTGIPYTIETTISLNDNSEPLTPNLTILISFINKQSVARIIKKSVQFPLNKLVENQSPQKDGIYKATLNLSQTIEMGMVFKGLDISDNGQVFGLKSLNSEHSTTFINAKKSNRYRLQSNSIQSLGFFLSILSKYIAENEKLQSSVSINLATIEYFLATSEKYHNYISETLAALENLSQETAQIRLFERCFLLKIQEKARKESTAFDILLNDTLNEIMSVKYPSYKASKTNVDRMGSQMLSAINFLRKILISGNDLKTQQDLIPLARFLCDEESDWLTAIAPYADYIQNDRELRTFDHFSLMKSLKSFKALLMLLIETKEALKGSQKALIEEPEVKEP